MTCGDAECQRRRHAESCRRWRRKNSDSTSSHYEDVVRPFRRRHPGYQRRWRIVAGLREIRDEIGVMTDALGARLRTLLDRDRARCAEAASEPAQVHATAGQPLAAALGVVALLADANVPPLPSSKASAIRASPSAAINPEPIEPPSAPCAPSAPPTVTRSLCGDRASDPCSFPRGPT